MRCRADESEFLVKTLTSVCKGDKDLVMLAFVSSLTFLVRLFRTRKGKGLTVLDRRGTRLIS